MSVLRNIVVVVFLVVMGITGFHYIKKELEKHVVRELEQNYYIYSDNLLSLLEVRDSIRSKYNLNVDFDSLLATKSDHAYNLLILNKDKQIEYISQEVLNITNPLDLMTEYEKYNLSPVYFGSFFFTSNQNEYLVIFRKREIKKEYYQVLILHAMADFRKTINRLLTYYVILVCSFSLICLLYLNVISLQMKRTHSKKKRLEKKSFYIDAIFNKNYFLPLLIVDQEGYIQSMSLCLLDALEMQEHEIKGKSIRVLFSFLDWKLDKIDFTNLSGKEIILKGNRAIEINVLTQVIPYKSEAEDSLYLFIFKDITYQKRSNERLLKELVKAKSFAKIAQLVASLPDPNKIIQTIVDDARDLIYYDSGTLFRLEKEHLVLYYTNDQELTSRMHEFKIALGEGLTGMVAKSGKGIILNDAGKSSVAAQVPDTTEIEECLISVPLISKGCCLGVATFSRNGSYAFTEEDLELFELLAALTATVLDNAMLFQQLSDSEKKYYELIEHSSIGIIILHNRKILFTNARFDNMLKMQSEEILNKDILQFIPEKDQAVFASQLTNLILENNPEIFELSLTNNERKAIIVEAGLSTIHWDNKVSIMVTCTDITTKVELNKQIQQSQKMESVGMMAGGLVHDFKNILQSIVGASEMLLRKIDEQSPAFNFAKAIMNSAEKGTKMTQRILEYSRKEETG